MQTDTELQTRNEEPDRQFVQYLFFKADTAWRRLPEEERAQGRREFAGVIGRSEEIATYSYSTLGLKSDADLMLWRVASSLDVLQDSLALLLKTGLGRYLTVSHSLFGMTRPSVYTKRRTPQEQARGLMFRTELGPNEGMVFPRNPPDVASFWMKNTPLPLDIIFIGEDGRIMNIAANTVPYSLDSVSAVGLTSAVLEIPGGRAAELGIEPGDAVEW